jgi:hypothetical protein
MTMHLHLTQQTKIDPVQSAIFTPLSQEIISSLSVKPLENRVIYKPSNRRPMPCHQCDKPTGVNCKMRNLPCCKKHNHD